MLPRRWRAADGCDARRRVLGEDGESVKMTLKRSVHELQTIVAATDLFFSGRCIDPALRLPVDLSIEELFVNLVKYNRGTDRDITVCLDCVGDAVEVSLTDHDVEPFDPTGAPELDIDAPLESRQPGGMGLYLVSKMVDAIHYEYRNRESKITFTKRMAQGHA
jgi:anti-sigma regulatory factor (Ser/Thr protein kinase)